MTEYSILELTTLSVFGALEAFAALALAFTLFRISHRAYLKELMALAASISLISMVLLDVMQVPFVLNELITLAVVLFFHMKWMRLTFGYSFLLTMAGYILKEVVVIAMSYLSLFAGFVPSLNSIMYEVPYTITVQFFTFIVTVPLALYLYRQGVGFVFLSEKVNFRTEFKTINVLILSSITLCLAALQILFYYYFVRDDVAYTAVIVGIIVFIAATWGVYLRSNRELESQVRQINITDLFK